MATVNPSRRRVRTLTRISAAVPRPRITPRSAAVTLVILAVLFGAWSWFRASSLVAVRQVEVTGVSGPHAAEIRGAVAAAARHMTTLDISTTRLERAVAGYGHIAGVRVSTHFPHRATVHVTEQLPVAAIGSGGRTVAVDGAGRLLPGESTASLPTLPAATGVDGPRVTALSTRAVLAVLATAPYQLLTHIKSARMTEAHGVVVTLLNGPQLYFGASSDLALKWRAADATLASSYSAGAAYIDVSSPTRPAAGS